MESLISGALAFDGIDGTHFALFQATVATREYWMSMNAKWGGARRRGGASEALSWIFMVRRATVASLVSCQLQSMFGFFRAFEFSSCRGCWAERIFAAFIEATSASLHSDTKADFSRLQMATAGNRAESERRKQFVWLKIEVVIGAFTLAGVAFVVPSIIPSSRFRTATATN